MGVKRDMIELAIMSAVMILLSIVGIVWDVSSRLLFSGVDGLLLLATCLLFLGVFSLMLLMTMKQMRAMEAAGAGLFPASAAASAPHAAVAVPPPPAVKVTLPAARPEANPAPPTSSEGA
jgi:hypothetical protein